MVFKKTTKLPHPAGNLGKYLHKPRYKSKLSSEPKTGKVSKLGNPTVKKPSRKRISKMIPQKGY
jgi:hypothetical protein